MTRLVFAAYFGLIFLLFPCKGKDWAIQLGIAVICRALIICHSSF